MADLDKKISELADADPVAVGDKLAVVQGGTTKKIDAVDFKGDQGPSGNLPKTLTTTIADPTELNSLSDADGDSRVVFQADGKVSLYEFSSAGSGESPPHSIDGSSGLYILVASTEFIPLGNKTFKANVIVEGQAHSESNTLTDAGTIATDCDLGNVHTVTLGGNRTLGAPTNLKNGATYIWIIKQDSTGGRTLDYNAVFKFEGGIAPTLSTGTDDVDILSAVSDGTSVFAQLIKDFS